MTFKKPIITGFLFIFAFIAIVGMVHTASTLTTNPQMIVYNGHLLDSAGKAIITEHKIRFSIWNSSDFLSGDVTSTGAINKHASTYASWQEVHTIIPNLQGYFSVELGSINTLFDISTMDKAMLINMHLQVEVKPVAANDSSYELLDINPSDSIKDRSPVLSVPFALNSDFLDQREIGTASGNIAILEQGNIFPTKVIPGGTNLAQFILDADNTTQSGFITLQFGQVLAKTLVYDIANGWFAFNDDVLINGNLTVNGLINGVDITNLTSAEQSHLKVTKATGLNINISAGNYRLNGQQTVFNGLTGVSVNNNATNYLYFNQAGLQINQTGFPVSERHIPLAIVVTTGGLVSVVTDRRVMQDDGGQPMPEKIVYHPTYPDASYSSDGSDNVGKLKVGFDQSVNANYYQWISTPSSLQDYYINVPINLPLDFTTWNDGALELTYRSASSNPLDNKLDILVYDTAGQLVTLSGSTTNLANTNWSTTRIEFIEATEWSPGKDMLVQIKVYSRNNSPVDVRELALYHLAKYP